MIKIEKKMEGDNLIVCVEGRLDTLTTPELEKEISDLSGIKNLYFELENLKYISSAGLRLIIYTQKRMKEQGKMIIRSLSPEVKDLLKITGFISVLNIECS